jgi:hypothetical protein
MNRCAFLSMILAVFAASAILSCTPTVNSERTDIPPPPVAGDNAESTSKPPPLVVDSDAPLLLDEPTQEQQASAGVTTQAAVENTACFVCHVNYNLEPLASRHAKANIGCAVCHGQSFEHKNDENNTTPPEKMYPADKIDSFCRSCHNSHDVPPSKVVAHWLKRYPDKTVPDEIVCTDCHGNHRIKVRTIIWDKKTGKLLSTNRGE